MSRERGLVRWTAEDREGAAGQMFRYCMPPSAPPYQCPGKVPTWAR